MNYVKNPTTGKCYSIVTKDGKAVKIKKTIFSECFYILAMSELARATQDNKYKVNCLCCQLCLLLRSEIKCKGFRSQK